MAGTRRSQIGRQVESRSLQLETLEQRRLLAGDAAALELSRFESAVELEEFLVGDALQRWDGLFGQPAWPIWRGGPIVDCPECAFFDVGFLAPGASPDHSATNTQVAGVDESDIVETDGDYLYMLSGQELIIVDSWEPDDLQVVSRVNIDGQPIGRSRGQIPFDHTAVVICRVVINRIQSILGGIDVICRFDPRRSVLYRKGEIVLIEQFTIHGDVDLHPVFPNIRVVGDSGYGLGVLVPAQPVGIGPEGPFKVRPVPGPVLL